MNNQKPLSDVIAMFCRTEMFRSGTPFTRSDFCNRTKESANRAAKCIEIMHDKDIIMRTTSDQKGHNRYIPASSRRKLLTKKWRSENAGELAYYKGFNHLGNADTGWRGAL